MDRNYFWQGEKIRLRSVSIDDWEEWLNDSENSHANRLLNLGISLPRSIEIAKSKFAEWANFKDTKEHIIFSIENLEKKLIGGISLHSKDEKNGTFSFGIRINENYRGKGYGTDALRVLLKYGFYELRFQKCNSSCINNNEGSIKLHEKLGFLKEGIQRRSIYTDGKYFDKFLFGLTCEEFQTTF